jgi:hypothetical protein
MEPLYPDKRKAITGEFFLQDSRIKNRSRKAFKKIQSWKASFQATEPDQQYQQQFENLVRQSFFNLVSNTYVLVQEEYNKLPLDN